MSTSILDNLAEMQKLDKSNILGSIQSLANQIRDAWNQVQSLTVTIDHARIRNVVVAGMGGSGLGPDVIKRVFKHELHVPFEIYNDYRLPAYVGSDTLVLLASYSGTTEETLAAIEQVKTSGAQAMVITTGGALAKAAQENGWPMYQILPTFNPSNQPRMALGYAVFGAVALFTKAGLLNLTQAQVDRVVQTVEETGAGLDVAVAQDANPAKQMAFHMVERIPVLIAAEHLEGALHAFTNQLNENAKIFAQYHLLPELNHHLMEGLRFPSDNHKNLFFVLFQSPLYHPRTQKRVEVTADVIEQAHLDSLTITIDSATALEQAFELITFGAYTNFYLAMLEGIDPAPIETVDYFKKSLG